MFIVSSLTHEVMLKTIHTKLLSRQMAENLYSDRQFAVVATLLFLKQERGDALKGGEGLFVIPVISGRAACLVHGWLLTTSSLVCYAGVW